MRRPSQPPPPHHAQRRPVVPTGRREALTGLGIGAGVALLFLGAWLSAGAPL